MWIYVIWEARPFNKAPRSASFSVFKAYYTHETKDAKPTALCHAIWSAKMNYRIFGEFMIYLLIFVQNMQI